MTDDGGALRSGGRRRSEAEGRNGASSGVQPDAQRRAAERRTEARNVFFSANPTRDERARSEMERAWSERGMGPTGSP